MTDLIIAFAGGAAGGAVAARLVLRHRGKRDEAPSADELPIDAILDANIDGAARALAHAQGRPGAASLIADKLKLAVRLRNRRLQRRVR